MSALPKTLGPYQLSVLHGDLLFLSGQIGIRPESGALAGDSVDLQARQALENIKAILEDRHSSMDKILKTTIFLVDISDFETVNKVYAEYFNGNFPARTTVAVKSLPKNARVEIEVVAHA